MLDLDQVGLMALLNSGKAYRQVDKWRGSTLSPPFLTFAEHSK
jgi:hypothetical protein